MLVGRVLYNNDVRCFTVGEVNVVPSASAVTGPCMLMLPVIVAGGQ